ncbi:NAD(P)/FAD-dependent oxidoreductase [Rhodococcus gannanensis]|uniref:NAD(P)/FAD-dependent oxidoreductase n=1 Tax=Rhodococcus gannanensis TaxID=1960308 RepID=A0ABW4PDD0_9NOCA
MTSTRIVVVGAGYAGVTAANRIRARAGSDVTVTMVNPIPEFVERIRLHQHAAGADPATRPLSEMLHRDVEVVVGSAATIGDGEVVLADGADVGFDHLVYAVGSGPGGDVPGIENAHSVSSLDGSIGLRNALDAARPDAVVTVIGGGLTGIETAAEIAERRPGMAVRLLSSGVVAPGLSDGGRDAVLRSLDRLGVEVREHTPVTRIAPGEVTVAGGSTAATDVVVWAGRFVVPDLARRSGLPVDEQGRLRTDETLTAVGRPDVIGVGDAVAPPDRVAHHLRMSCQAAIPLGVHGADTVLARLKGREPKPLSIGMTLQCVSLGRGDGVVQVVHRDDSPRRLVLRGRRGSWVKEQICRGTVGLIAKYAGSYRGMPGPRSQSERVGVSA